MRWSDVSEVARCVLFVGWVGVCIIGIVSGTASLYPVESFRMLAVFTTMSGVAVASVPYVYDWLLADAG